MSKSNGFVQNQSQNLKFHAEIWYSVDQKTKSRENKIRSTLNEASEVPLGLVVMGFLWCFDSSFFSDNKVI